MNRGRLTGQEHSSDLGSCFLGAVQIMALVCLLPVFLITFLINLIPRK